MRSGIYLMRISENKIRGNVIGLHVAGGRAAYIRDNTIAENTNTDLYSEPNMVIDARDNFWDHANPLILVNGGGRGGIDIYNPRSSATIDTTGAQLKQP